MEVAWATDVFMLLRELLGRMQTAVSRNQIAVIFQDRLYLLQPGHPLSISQPAAVVDALRKILSRQAQQPQTQTIGLLRVPLCSITNRYRSSI